ncbi:MAG: AAA domain-containing protein [Caloramator sp.]|nr:AAA domain-containing protein [Caloramator sp.]
MSAKNEYLNLLNFWHKIECFNPYIIQEKSTKLLNNDDVPWVNKELNIIDKHVQYQIYFGIFSIEESSKIIHEYFKNETQNIEKDNSHTCIAQFIINEEGKFISDSLSFSTIPWALSALKAGKLYVDNWWKNFLNYVKQSTEIINTYLCDSCTFESLENALEKINEMLDIGLVLNKYSIKYIEKKIKYPQNKSNEINDDNESYSESSQILNSFFIKDLEKVISSVKNRNYGIALDKYLNLNIDTNNRINLDNNIEEYKKILSPTNIQYGRWPSDPKKSLSLMQQVAVNLIMTNLSGKSGIFSVNGPPGTGKTTLIRDIIASIIVKRAIELSKYENPTDAFTNIGSIVINNKSYIIYKPDDLITQDSMVVASTNNGAVENISKELPANTALYNNFNNIVGANYFKEVANNLSENECWGLIAAVLGNSKNKNDFACSFWSKDKQSPLKVSIKSYLMESKKNNINLYNWKNAKDSFTKKLNEVQERLKEYSNIESIIVKYECLKKENNALNLEFKNITEELLNLDNKYLYLNEELEKIQIFKQNYIDHLNILKKNRPWWIFSFFNKDYRQKIKKYKKLYFLKAEEYSEKKIELNSVNRDINTLKKKHKNVLDNINKIEGKINEYSIKLNDYKNKYKCNLPDNNFWSQSKEELQKKCPWLDENFNKIQSELFLEALNLHQRFIEIAYIQFINNLEVFVNLLKNNINISNNLQYIKPLWDTFFLVVPVISTTFASVSSMFCGLDKESIGWLFIDEAGQAVPQAAVGAIWRSKRVIAVGDPLQILPVVTIPDSIIKDLSEHYKIPPEYGHSEISVQNFADKSNNYGSYINNHIERQWIGCPLRVHRRCLEPMFSISNNIAYNGMMVYATNQPDKNKDILSQIGVSRWIDVKGESNPAHWIPNQGEVIKNLFDVILKVHNKADILSSLYIISPFKTVVNELQKEIPNYILNNFNFIEKSYINKWTKNNIGTVHTFQGKEANTVIFCLGVDKNNISAAAWAAKSPNILNVAATRAINRFIVIGDIDVWHNMPYFNKLSNMKIDKFEKE